MGDGTEQLCLIKALTGCSLDLVRTMAYKKALDMMNSEVRMSVQRPLAWSAG